jgi:hypothetical protein
MFELFFLESFEYMLIVKLRSSFVQRLFPQSMIPQTDNVLYSSSESGHFTKRHGPVESPAEVGCTGAKLSLVVVSAVMEMRTQVIVEAEAEAGEGL